MFGIKPRQVITFSRQLATLLESGVGLLPALQLLESEASGGSAFGRVVRAIGQDLGTGKSFAQAAARHPAAFTDIYIRTVSVGEQTGNMEAVLREMADFQEKQAAFAKKVSGALTYPAITLFVGLAVSFILITVALSPLSKLFESLNTDLPMPTRILLGLSDFLTSYMLYLGVAFGIIIAGLIIYLRRPDGRRMMDRIKLNVPILGSAVRLAELARVNRTMAVLLTAGLNLQEVMELLPRTSTNSVVQDALHQVRRGLFLGQGLTYPMSGNSFFPPLMLQMVRVGEETNTLETNLTVLANFYESNADEKTAAVLGMITPLSTIMMAVMAAFVALSVIMPMYQITGAEGLN